jgi:hypothetical protein
VLFREGVLAFIGVKEQESAEQKDQEAYEAAVKMQERLDADGKQ